MPRVLADLYPEKVFYYFEQISAIPRGSGNVKKINKFLDKLDEEQKDEDE